MASRIPLLNTAISKLSTKRVPWIPKQAEQTYRTPDFVAWSKAVKERARYQCEACGARDTKLYADHIQEVKDGGALHDLANGQALCAKCHGKKTSREKILREIMKEKMKRAGGVIKKY